MSKYELDRWQEPSEKEVSHPKQKGRTLTFSSWGGWQWTTKDATYRTNENGEGLWELVDGRFTQVQGTSSFSLPQNRNQALAKLKREGLPPRLRPEKPGL